MYAIRSYYVLSFVQTALPTLIGSGVFAILTSSPVKTRADVDPEEIVFQASAQLLPPLKVTVPLVSEVDCQTASSRVKLSASTTVIFHRKFNHDENKLKVAISPVVRP